ncbi:MAG: type II toxin-antitoxin system VapC family toxin [Ginsengibacter sp.]
MADKVILADTSILIDYFRKTDKTNSRLIALFDQGYDFNISAVTHYEIYSGATSAQLPFWTILLARTKVLALDQDVAQVSADINNILKRKRKQIGMADLFIAATAISNNLSLATLNINHFERIDGLNVI